MGQLENHYPKLVSISETTISESKSLDKIHKGNLFLSKQFHEKKQYCKTTSNNNVKTSMKLRNCRLSYALIIHELVAS